MDQFAGPSRGITPQVREHSSSVWEGLRDQITQLHSVQDKPLIEVMGIIETEHGFVASLRQYKIKISEWHVGKNIKGDEYKFIAQTQAKRAQEEKDTNFRVRGREVPPEKIARAVKRQKLSDQELVAMPSIPTPSDISYGTPSAVDPQSPYVQQAIAPSPGPTFPTFANQALIHSNSNISEWQNQAFLVSPGYLPATPLPVVWHNPSTPLPSASFQTPPGMLQSPSQLWNTGPMHGIIEDGDTVELTDDSDACNTKYERLVELIRRTEELTTHDYMETMSEVNSLLCDLIAFDQLRSQDGITENSASITKCYVCRALEILGTKDMAAKVESERILLEAIAISEGCFGEEHRGALHFRVELYHLYNDWSCRTDSCGVTLLQILLSASRKAPSLQAHELLSNLVDLPGAADPTKCLWLQVPSWGFSLDTSSQALSTLSIRNVATPNSPHRIWEMVSTVADRNRVIADESRDTIELLLGSILQQGAGSADGPLYFWMAVFIAAFQRMWGAIYNSKMLIISAIGSGSSSIRFSLEHFFQNPYRLEQSTVIEISADTKSTSASMLSIPNLQSGRNESSKIMLGSLEDLSLALAEVSLGNLEKLDNNHIFQALADIAGISEMHSIVCSAARLGHSTLITKLGQNFGNAAFYGGDVSFINILNLDGEAADFDLGEIPIVSAIEGGHCRSVEALLDAGVDPDGVEGSDQTPVELAAESDHDDIVRLLIGRGADVSYASMSVMKSALRSSDQNILDSILETFVGFPRNMLDTLCYLILVGRFERYERLDLAEDIKEDMAWEKRAGIRSGYSLLSFLEKDECESFLDFLNKEDLSGRGLELILNVLTGVHIEQQARSILKSVLFNNDAVDEMLQPTEASDSPVLHTLVSRNAPNALGVFLDLEPNLATLDLQGNTALHIAARLNRVACAKLLLNRKIDVNVENNDGKTALQIALQWGYKEISNEIFMVLPMYLVVEEES